MSVLERWVKTGREDDGERASMEMAGMRREMSSVVLRLERERVEESSPAKDLETISCGIVVVERERDRG